MHTVETPMDDIDIDSIDTCVREACEQHDRFMAEQRHEAAPVQRSAANGLTYRERESTAPAPAAEAAYYDQEGEPHAFTPPQEEALAWVIAELQREHDNMSDAVARLREEFGGLREEFRGLREELAELRGFANAVRGISAPERWFKLRGEYREGGTYNRLDVVGCDGSWFVAKCDDAGACPGRDWMRGPVGEPGLRGERGLRGSKGERGRDAPKFASWDVDRVNYRAVAKMSDGSTMTLELRPLFEQFISELEQRRA
jgi:hypothetical protein